MADFKVRGEVTVKDKGSKTVKKFSKEATSSFSKVAAAAKSLAGPLALGAVIVAFRQMATEVINYADELQKLHIQLGVSTTSLDKLKQVADLSGVSFRAVTTSIRMMQKNLVDATNGIGEAKDIFEELNLNVEDLINLSPEEQFLRITEAIDKVENSSIKQNYQMKIMGGRSSELIRMQKELRQKLEDTSSVMSKELTDSMATFNDNITKFKATLDKLVAISLGPIIKDINELNTAINKLFDLGDQEALTKVGKVIEFLYKIVKRGSGAQNLKDTLDAITGSASEAEAAGGQWADAIKEIVDAEEELRKAREKSLKALPPTMPTMTKVEGPLEDMLVFMEVKLTNAVDVFKRMLEKEKALTEEWAEYEKDIRDETYEERIKKLAEVHEKIKENNLKIEEAEQEKQDRIKEIQEKALEEQKQKIAEQKAMWEDFGSTVEDSFANAFADFVVGTKDASAAFKSFAKSVIQSLGKIAAQKMADYIIGLFGSIYSGSAGGSLGTYSGASGGGRLVAEGGVLSGGFKAFQDGGMVTKPTLGLIGEGSMNEAVVPLPDGRSIPVEQKGGGGEATQNTFIIQAMDSKSFVEFTRRNPAAIIGPITDSVNKGNTGLRSTLQKAVR